VTTNAEDTGPTVKLWVGAAVGFLAHRGRLITEGNSKVWGKTLTKTSPIRQNHLDCAVQNAEAADRDGQVNRCPVN